MKLPGDFPATHWIAFALCPADCSKIGISEAAETLEILISRWPDKKIYWTQLSQIYYKLKQEDRALAVMALVAAGLLAVAPQVVVHPVAGSLDRRNR